MQLVEILKQRRRIRLEARLGHRLAQLGPVVDGFDQHLLQERRADEIRWLRIGKPARIFLRPFQQLCRGLRHAVSRRAGGVVEKHHLGPAPRAFESIGRNGEISQDRRLVLMVDIGPVRQAGGPVRRHQELLALHRGKVLAIDPDEIDRAAFILAGRFFGQHLGHRVGGVIEFHVNHLDAEAVSQRLSGPADIAVDVLGAAPGVEIDGLALGLLQHGIPVTRVGVGGVDRKGQAKRGTQRAGKHGRKFQHGSPPQAADHVHTPQALEGVK